MFFSDYLQFGTDRFLAKILIKHYAIIKERR